MMMFRIATYEFRYMFFSLQSLVSACLFFGLAFLFMANGVEFQQVARGGNVYINSPYMIANFLLIFGLFAVFIAPSYMAGAVLKDSENQFDGILFSTPIDKNSYIFGRFFGAFVALMLVLAAAPTGMYLGTFWPWAASDLFAPNDIGHYLTVFFGFLLPTVFTLGAVVFTVAVMSRSMMYSYLAALGILILYIAVSSTQTIAPIWDPFMLEVLSEQTKYWTAVERNSTMVPYAGDILLNRLLWLGVAVSFFVLAYSRLSFRTPAKVVKQDPAGLAAEAKLKTAVETGYLGSPDWHKNTHWHQLWFRTKFEMLSVLKSKPFMLLMGFSLFLLFFALTGRPTLYDVNTYPVTRLMLGAIREALTLALMAVLAFYSADVIWREKTSKFSDIIDALPAPNWVFAISKIAALALVMQAIVLMGVIIAVSLQVVSGYHEFQLDLYITRGLIYYPMAYVFLAVLTCFFQVLTQNRVVGILCFMVFMAILASSRDIFGTEHMLLSYGLPGIAAPLSDMNSDSRLATAGWWARVYWASIAGLLLMLTYMLWNRGTLQPLKFRLVKLRAFKSSGFALPAAALLALFVSSGSYIFYNTNVLNKYRTMADIEQIRVDYELKYRQYEDLPMPQTVDVKIAVDIYPYRRRVEARSTQVLQNNTDQVINSVHLVFPVDVQVPVVELQDAVQKSVDADLAYYIFDLATPMTPGEQRTLKFETIIQQQGFVAQRNDIRLVRNGTFIGNHQVAPYIGFYAGHMLKDIKKRQKYGLPPLGRMPKLEDVANHSTNFLRQDSDFIHFETTVSTVVGQTAISPGYLVNEWTEGDRHYFSYKMDAPMTNFYSFLSADYEVAQDSWNDVNIEVLYHSPHVYNVQDMMDSVKDSLTYFSEAFGPYQYRQVRIMEFPAYRNFAQAFPNTIPFSEGIGFIADVRDPKQVNLPYYVTAHEMAHQWWGHQVMAVDAQGGTMLVETMSQYSALMVMEQKYGKHQIRQFLKRELDTYLADRVNEVEGEMPLYKVENQSYIHYRKGAMIMYALKDYVGEAVVNRALKRLVKNHAYQSAPYAVSTDLLRYFKEEAGVEYLTLIEDFFEKVTIFDLKHSASTVTQMADGRFKVSLDVEAAKFYEDGLGKQTSVTMDIPVDIGLFVKSPSDSDFSEADVIMLEKRFIRRSKSTIELIVDQKPAFAGIDPYNKLIDRNSDDNLGVVAFLGSF
jgi:ABC-type transport system involved in multi-copper enzyme maturation permease subunit